MRGLASRIGRNVGGALAVRLVSIVLIPSLGLAWLGVHHMTELHTSVDDVAEVAESIALHRSALALAQYGEYEQIGLEVRGLVDSMGIPPGIVSTLLGDDIEDVFEQNERDFDRALDDFRAHVLAGTAGVDPAFATTLDRVERAVDLQRRRIEEGSASHVTIGRAFDVLDELVDDVLRSDGVDAAGARVLVIEQTQLDALSALTLSAGVFAEALIDAVGGVDGFDEDDLRELWAVHGTRLDSFDELLGDEGSEQVDGMQIQVELIADLVDGLGESGPLSEGFTTDDIAHSVELVTMLVEHLVALTQYSDAFRLDVLDTAEALRSQVLAEEARTRWLMVAVGVTTAALLAFAIVTIVAPLRRLNRRARDITDGELALEPLPVRGPGDVRTLTRTVNEMLSTLHLVDRQITGLASGSTAPGSIEVPGAIGVSLRESVEHLADVTHQLHRSEELASAIVEQAVDAIWTVDADGMIRSANTASEHLVGVPAVAQIGRPITDFLDALEGETSVAGYDGKRVLVASSTIDVDDERLRAVMARDVSERFRLQEQLAHQARHDALTGLPNRHAALEQLEALHGANADAAVLFIDIDGFKNVNDTKGHDAGDRVLEIIAERLSRIVRSTDTIARLGGDEFLVLVEGYEDLDHLEAVGRRLIREVELPYEVDGGLFTLSASVGVATIDRDTSALEAIRRADSAVYLAKAHGRGRVEAFDADLQATIERDAEMELALRRAIPAHELVLHLQPVVDLANDEPCGAEALVRWNRPGVGLVLPGEFIAIAERSSLIFALECWVLERACETVARWRQTDRRCAHRLAVNISGRHLIDGDLMGDLERVLAQTGADPRMLEFELTETQLLEDSERAIEVLTAIRERGITVAVDDFGTGYSSMTYLRDLPVDTLKIDRTFLVGGTSGGEDAALLDAMVTIGRNLNLAVVAEGVETEEQLDHVRRLGCDRAQGHLLARPMALEAAEDHLLGHLAGTG